MAYVIEVDYYNLCKYNQIIPGDSILLNRTFDKRMVITLADGLGSGVKANVLSQLTACMSQKFMIAGIDSIHTANTIMATLPVCSKREISYSTLTTLNIDQNGFVKILEYDNPELLWIRGQELLLITRQLAGIKTNTGRNEIFYSEIKLEYGDRLIFFTDGVTQSGIGLPRYPLGWGLKNLIAFTKEQICAEPDISAKKLSKAIVCEAQKNDNDKPKDDITCAVVYYRQSRDTLLLTGPPSERSKCSYMIEKFKRFEGKKIVSGGTTSQIIAKGINETITIDMSDLNSDIPPRSKMNQADLVTEGMLTINKVINLLSKDDINKIENYDAAYKLAQLLLDSDSIYCLVGTAINEAHQSASMPIEMGIRRTAMNRLAEILRNKYLKHVTIEYV